LMTAVQRLERRQLENGALLKALERDRDRHRADAVAARETAIRLNAYCEELVAALSRLVDAMRQQLAAVDQLLLPGSPVRSRRTSVKC
jgi:hypothetical protein